MALSQNTNIEVTFHNLVSDWRKGRGPVSSVTQMVMHPSYQRIIGLGQPAIPLILGEMKQQPDQWFWALKAISGENPVPQEHAGDVKRMTEDWLNWGSE